MRPRLVEEGKPISHQISDEDYHRHVSELDEEYEKATSAINNNDNRRITQPNHKKSSLQSLKSLTSSKEDYKLKTSIVIGSQASLTNNDSNGSYSRTQTSFEIGKAERQNETEYDIDIHMQANNDDASMDIDDHDNIDTLRQDCDPIASCVPTRMEIDDTLAKSPLVVVDGKEKILNSYYFMSLVL